MSAHKHEEECHDEHCCCHGHEHEHEHEHEHHHHEHDDCGCGCGCGCGHDHGHGENAKGEWLRLAAAAVLFVGGIVLSLLPLPSFVSLILYGAAYLTAGYAVLSGAVRGILKGDWFGEDFLMAVASIGAFVIGEYAEACAVMLLFELGERLQDRAVAKSRDSIRSMLELRPERVQVERDGKAVTVTPDEVKVGDILLVLPGEKVACDGEVLDGSGDMDMAALTGESLPVAKQAGDSVLAGSISIDSTFRIRATEAYDNSTVAKILEMLEHAKANKSPTESFIHRFSKVYTPAVCLFALCVAVLPPLFGLGDFGTWIYRGLCALAASCPCALVISVPLGFFGGLGAASRAGVLVKGGNYLEALAAVDAAAFDKTGTITAGKFVYSGDENAADAQRLHRAVAICEKYSTHPIAVAATEAFGALADDAVITEAAAIPGRGVRATVGDVVYLCGNAALMREEGIAFTEAEGLGTAVYAAENGQFLGSVTFADALKADSASAMRELASLGIADTVMLTGDKLAIAEDVGMRVGIGAVHAELLPADKAERFAAEKAKGKKMVYVGDGINDAPVLALADVGVAMGGIGSAAALEAADAVIMGDSLLKLPEVIRIARRTMRIVRENIVFSLAIKLLIVVLSAFGITNLWVAVFGDVGVCLLAVLNSLRVMQTRK
ncbi:MAG: cadmium-translocating P-type ATPase [Clostridia bacterium]|nr:cadmium-translocating P-type ATPase [Clostridia bacterium]